MDKIRKYRFEWQYLEDYIYKNLIYYYQVNPLSSYVNNNYGKNYNYLGVKYQKGYNKQEPEEKICPFCGAIRKEIDHFCSYCGIENNFKDQEKI